MKIIRVFTFMGLWAAYWFLLVLLLASTTDWMAILLLPVTAVPALFTTRAILGRKAR